MPCTSSPDRATTSYSDVSSRTMSNQRLPATFHECIRPPTWQKQHRPSTRLPRTRPPPTSPLQLNTIPSRTSIMLLPTRRRLAVHLLPSLSRKRRNGRHPFHWQSRNPRMLLPRSCASCHSTCKPITMIISRVCSRGWMTQHPTWQRAHTRQILEWWRFTTSKKT